MPDDLRALLAAIVADPADDTARLVYADCLQEHGNLPRADFIRLQIEAERLHPDSNARARLEDQSKTLFAEHWIEWWRKVCTEVGFPRPTSRPRGAWGRLARRIGVTGPAGHPFASTSQFTVRFHDRRDWDTRARGWAQTTFRRGFPDSVYVSTVHMNANLHCLHHWVTGAPLADLSVAPGSREQWIDGPHLAGLRSLTLIEPDPVAFHGTINSPYLTQLEALAIREADDNHDVAYLYEFARAMQSPRMRQIKRLSIPLWSHRAAEVVAGAENLAGLEALEVSLQPAAVDDDMEYGSADLAVASERLAMLARSPYLAGLRELKVVGGVDAAGVEAAIRNPMWTGLRKLDLQLWFWPDQRGLLDSPNDLPELDELRLSGVSYSVAQVAALARSPLLKRLRHFALRGGPYLSVDFDIAHAVDPDRIETFAIGEQELQSGVAAKLRDHFGDRFRVLT